jgi:hypothetical protein
MADETPQPAISGILKSLPMQTMFAAPVMAAIDCHAAACQRVVEFINQVGFNQDKTVRMVRFEYSEPQFDAQGNPTGQNIKRVVDLPFIATVPLPSLGVEKVTVDFDLSVDTSDTSSKSDEASASLEGSVGFAWWKVNFKGSYTHKSEQIRKTDTRARYTVHLEATRQDPPEALMRVIDAITNASTKPLPKDKAPALADAATK